jgi:hypothetical protein
MAAPRGRASLGRQRRRARARPLQGRSRSLFAGVDDDASAAEHVDPAAEHDRHAAAGRLGPAEHDRHAAARRLGRALGELSSAFFPARVRAASAAEESSAVAPAAELAAAASAVALAGAAAGIDAGAAAAVDAGCTPARCTAFGRDAAASGRIAVARGAASRSSGPGH